LARAATHIFRASLGGKQSIRRDIEIASTDSLYKLAEAITVAFDFDFDHAFGFYSGLEPRTMMHAEPRYELFADLDLDSDAKSVMKTKLAEAFPKVGHTMGFLFDYGDDWLFHVEMIGEGQKVAKVKYPRVIAKKGAAPIQYPDPDDEEFE
jgi:hypothetical protein